MSEIPTDKHEFDRHLAVLFEGADHLRDNPGSYRSEECVRCYDCMFSTRSTQCYQCTYCADCESCNNCTHCKWCRHCDGSNYCVESMHCSGCSYVIMSRYCYDCVFCFGCVGLVKKEFHILNQPFRRDEYFRIVKELKATYGF